MCINLVQVVCTDCCTQEAYVPYMEKTSKVCNSCYEQLSKLTVIHDNCYHVTVFNWESYTLVPIALVGSEH